MYIKEDFLQYLWMHKLLPLNNLKTTNGESVIILSPGSLNVNSGSDFFNAKLIIDDQTWAGNVEIHVKSSDWYVHHHETDPSYDNVILHVVWEHDVDIFNKRSKSIPTIALKSFVSKNLLQNYHKLFSKRSNFISCEGDIKSVSNFIFENWLERLYVERLAQKSEFVVKLIQELNGDWEAVLFKLLAKNFGLKVNGEVFYELSNSFDFSIFRKNQYNLENLEALLYGQAGFLSDNIDDNYYHKLKTKYNFLKHKYSLEALGNSQFQFFRLRPNNFPTIRIAQLASLYFIHKSMFSKIIEIENLEEFYELFDKGVSEFWKTHYNFSSLSKKSNKKLSRSFIDLLLINSIFPLLFEYYRQQGKLNNEKILSLIQQLKPESNSVIENFSTIELTANNAMQSQAFIQLKNEYCNKYRCLQCAIGNALLRENSM
ncbi:MAG: DUF2851 family protein [Bacteroidota bacterium]